MFVAACGHGAQMVYDISFESLIVSVCIIKTYLGDPLQHFPMKRETFPPYSLCNTVASRYKLIYCH